MFQLSMEPQCCKSRESAKQTTMLLLKSKAHTRVWENKNVEFYIKMAVTPYHDAVTQV